MARASICLHGETGFWRCWWTFWSLIEHLPHAERISGVVSQHCVLLQMVGSESLYSWLLRYKWLEHWLAFTAKPRLSTCWGTFWFLIDHAERYAGVVNQHWVYAKDFTVLMWPCQNQKVIQKKKTHLLVLKMNKHLSMWYGSWRFLANLALSSFNSWSLAIVISI